MKTIRLYASLFAFAFASNAMADLASSPSGTYSLDKSHGYITFSYSHLGFSTPHVGFDSFDVTLDLDSEAVAESTVEVTVDAASINSRVAAFDDHLNSADFFHTSEFPSISFVSTAIEATGDSTYDVTGDLTIKGITKSVVLAMTVNKAAMHPRRGVPTIGVSGETKVNRSDFDLGLAAPAVGDEVTINVTAELMKGDD